MKKLLVPLVALLVMIFIVTGCSTSITSPTPTAPATTPAPTTTAPTKTAPSPSVSASIPNPTTIAPEPTVTTAGSTIKKGGVMRYITNQSPGNPIGWNAEALGASVFTMQLSLQFLLKEQLGGALTPNLAESYDVTTDPPTMTFHLRKGVKFSDGSDFNAQAVKFSLDWTKKGGLNAGTTNYWKQVDVIDDYTVRVTFTQWQNRVLRGFADGAGYIVSPTAYEKNGLDWIRWNMVGTGAFIQTNFQKDVSLTTKKNPNYWEQGKPYLDGVQLLYVSDAMTRLALFKSGGGDILDLAGSTKDAVDLTNSGYKILTQPGASTILVPDSANADSPWSNAKVRQAAEYAIDRESLSKALGYGYWVPSYQILSSANLGYDSSIPGRKYDVAKAKQLMVDAGYPNGFKTSIIYQTGTNADVPVAIQAYLSKVGINAEIQSVDAVKYSTLTTGTWKNGLLINPLIEWANPNSVFNFFFGMPGSFFNQTVKKPDNWKDLLFASLQTTKPDPVYVKKLENAAYDDAMVIPLYAAPALFVVNDTVQDSGIGTRGASTWWEPQQAWLK